MAKPFDSGSDPDDILGLIADVHTDTPVQEDRLERALSTLESTHRAASASMQRFERTGRTTATRPPSAPEALSSTPGLEAGSGAEPEGAPSRPRAKTHKPEFAPLSREVTQMAPIPSAPPRAPAPQQQADEPTRTAIAKPQKPMPVAEVLSGRGAEFAPRGHTKTHIVHPKINLPKK